MSATQVDRPAKVSHLAGNGKKESEKSRKLFNASHKKHKHDESRHFKFGRKRLQSFTCNGKFFPPYKRRKNEGIIPPTKFLLGGNICDPLNLNSMQDEEINRAMNAVTPKSSPLPTPKHRKETIEVIIPPNICDPLNLSNCNDNEEYEKQLISPTKKGAKRRNRKRKRACSDSGKDDVNDTIDSKDSGDREISVRPETPKIIPVENPPIEPSIVEPSIPSAASSMEIEETTTTPTTTQTPTTTTTTTTTTLITTTTTTTMTVATTTAVMTATAMGTTETTTCVEQIVKTETKLSSPVKDKSKLRLKGLDECKDKRLRKIDLKDKIVSPVIPQPGAWKPRLPHRPSQDKKKKQHQQQQQQHEQYPQQQEQQQPMPNFRVKDARYQYGNYNRYYGYRNPHHDVDTRLTVFAQREELFRGKDVLDIGCNIGHITLSVARDCAAHSVTGIDIDRKLIGIARKNVKHYVNCVGSPASNEDVVGGEKHYSDQSFFPLSMPINYGPIDVPGFTKNNEHKGFPYNVTFVQGNYVLEDDALLKSEQPQFDTILCLSITKWIHLNFGDAGLKQAFKRMHAQLRPGGVLLLEPQGWASYGKKKKLTERTFKTYQSIEFFPQKFTQYLLSPEVGFNKCEVVSVPAHPSKGFQRPIQLFTKAGASPINTWTPRDATPTSTTTAAATATSATADSIRSQRFVGRHQKQKDHERRAFERDLFPQELPELPKSGDLSNQSQRSIESLSQYEQLANVYAPSTTPCYDTPSHNAEYNQPFEPEKIRYVDDNNSSNETTSQRDNSPPTALDRSNSQQTKIMENSNSADNRTVNEKSNILHRKRKIDDAPMGMMKKERRNGRDDEKDDESLTRETIRGNRVVDETTTRNDKSTNPNDRSAFSASTTKERKRETTLNNHQRNESTVLSELDNRASPRNHETRMEKT